VFEFVNAAGTVQGGHKHVSRLVGAKTAGSARADKSFNELDGGKRVHGNRRISIDGNVKKISTLQPRGRMDG
jgi:hypothetical protein